MQLILMGGLPGSGKSTVAEGVARALGITILSADPVEAALRRAGIAESQSGIASYLVLEALAGEQLKLGRPVIIDAVNPVEAARAMWRTLARKHRAGLHVIECVCRDEALHRARVEARVRDIAGLPELIWERVERRKANHDPWTDQRLVLETDVSAPQALIAAALAYLTQRTA
jgi:predicted kinase